QIFENIDISTKNEFVSYLEGVETSRTRGTHQQQPSLYLTYEGSKHLLASGIFCVWWSLYLTYEGSKRLRKEIIDKIRKVCILPKRDRNMSASPGANTSPSVCTLPIKN